MLYIPGPRYASTMSWRTTIVQSMDWFGPFYRNHALSTPYPINCVFCLSTFYTCIAMFPFIQWHLSVLWLFWNIYQQQIFLIVYVMSYIVLITSPQNRHIQKVNMASSAFPVTVLKRSKLAFITDPAAVWHWTQSSNRALPVFPWRLVWQTPT